VAVNNSKINDNTIALALVADDNISIDDTPEVRAVLKALTSGNGHISSLTAVVPGTMTANGSVYTGSIKATITSDGQVTNYCRHGYGVLKTHSGNYHKGQWRDMVAHGYGEFTRMRNGKIESQYKGEFVKGERHGSAREIADDRIYEGTWVNNQRHGEFKHYTSAGHLCNTSRWNSGNRFWLCYAQDDVASTTNIYSSSFVKRLDVVQDLTRPNGDKYKW
jgi:MORN repeat